VKNGGSLILIWLIVLLAVVSFFIIMNTIKLVVTARKDEVSIMRYVGASGFFVSFPFILEGIILGLFSAVGAYGLLHFCYKFFVEKGFGSNDIIQIIPFEQMNGVILAFFFGGAVVLGVFGSLVSLRKYNRG
jgi:cell division transport system permease protein